MNGWYKVFYRTIRNLYRQRLCVLKQLDTLMRAKLLGRVTIKKSSPNASWMFEEEVDAYILLVEIIAR
jgi:hypothetical protein